MSDFNTNNNNTPSPDPPLTSFVGTSVTDLATEKTKDLMTGKYQGHTLKETSSEQKISPSISSFTSESYSQNSLSNSSIEIKTPSSFSTSETPQKTTSFRPITPTSDQSFKVKLERVYLTKSLQVRAAKIAQELKACRLDSESSPTLEETEKNFLETSQKLLIAPKEKRKLPHLYPPKIGNTLELLDNSQGATITIMHSDREETIHPQNIATTLPQKKGISPPCLLIFGVQESRQKLINKLNDTFGVEYRTPMMIMNELNSYVGLGENNVFLKLFKIQQGILTIDEKLLQKSISTYYRNIPSEKTEQLLPIAQKWVQFLKENSSKFDFSEKLKGENWVSFLIKNIDLNGKEKLASLMFPKEKTNLQEIKMLLLPAKDFLIKVLEIAKTSPNEDYFRNSCQLIYPHFGDFSETIKPVIVDVAQNAIWRKTSKLGLSFAAEQGIPVLFSWQLPGQENDTNAIVPLLEVAPYKATPPHFYSYVEMGRETDKKSPLEASYQKKPISVSEFHELGRLLHQELENLSDKIAPNFLLIHRIGELSLQQQQPINHSHLRSAQEDS